MRKLLALALALLLSGCATQATQVPTVAPSLTPPPTTVPAQAAEETTTRVTITAIGDIMVHSNQITAAYDPKTGSYNFDRSFADLKPVFESSDLTIGNLETTFAGNGAGYSGYPKFNTPDALADNLKKAGIDWVSTANNHCLDKGEAGLRRTIQVLDQAGLIHAGTYASQQDRDKNLIQDIHGIKIAFLSYTGLTNGIPVPKGKDYLVNRVNLEEISSKVRSARQEGADLVILNLHTGVEYRRQPTEEQQKLFHDLIKAGVDIILGSHPHVLEPIARVEVTDGAVTREGVIIYSLGNFVSSQKAPYTDSGIVLSLTVEKKGTNVKVQDIRFIPTWLLKTSADGKAFFRVLPVEKALKDFEQKKDPDLSPETYQTLKRVWQDTTQLLTNREQSILPENPE